MKKTKFMASLLAIILLMATMTTTLVSADEPDSNPTANLTVENTISTSGITIKDKTYNLYQVFSAEVTESDDEDDAIEYTVNPDFYEFFAERGFTYPTEDNYSTLYPDADDLDYAIIAYNHAANEYVSSFSSDEDKDPQDLVTLLRDYIDGKTLTATATTGSYSTTGSDNETVVAQNVEYGYYIVFDTEALTSETATSTVTNGSLVTIPGRAEDGSLSANVTISLKGSTPAIDKDIWHNDITNVDGDNSLILASSGSWDDVADYQIGDKVEFRLTITLPSDISAYTDYEYIITDTLSDGLVFNNDIAYYTDAALTQNVSGKLDTITYGETNDDPYTFQIDLDIEGIKNSNPALEKLYIYYTATVTDEANIYTDYEQNEVTLKYSNNPYNSSSYGNDSDTVYGYTFVMNVLKTTGDGVTPLADAEFALYEILDSTDGTTHYQQVYLTQSTDSSLEIPTYYLYGTTTNPENGLITTDEYGKFDIIGLDDAKSYALVEVNAPEGYNVADKILFKIGATYSTSSTTGVPTPTLKITGNTDSLDIKVINTSASLLPETGGIGTTIFIIVGVAVMLIAVILLVVRRRRTTVKYK